VKLGDLVKASPQEWWEINREDNTFIGVVTHLGVDDELLRGFPDKIVVLNFGDDDGVFRPTDWKFEVISENR
jgi:hypothetical protein|tara:strand:- start:580 stop:795 length:216 start_codon:yes stop_codon:yes gene_type:complete